MKLYIYLTVSEIAKQQIISVIQTSNQKLTPLITVIIYFQQTHFGSPEPSSVSSYNPITKVNTGMNIYKKCPNQLVVYLITNIEATWYDKIQEFFFLELRHNSRSWHPLTHLQYHTHYTPHLVGLLWTTDQPDAETST